MGNYNESREIEADCVGPLVITWTANEPTAALTQTIADGDSPTAAETGQFMQNVNTILASLVDRQQGN